MNKALVYGMGQGKDRIREFLQERAQDLGGHKVLMPNRSLIKYYKEAILASQGGIMGLDFLTFDDLAQTYSFRKVQDKKDLLAYIVQDRLREAREAFPILGPSFDFLSSVRGLMELFRELDILGQGPEGAKDLPYSYRDEIQEAYKVYRGVREDLGAYSLEEAYLDSEKNLSRGLFPGEALSIIGFSSFRSLEWRLIEALGQAGFSIQVHLPFDRIERPQVLTKTLDRLKDLGFEVQDLGDQDAQGLKALAQGQVGLRGLNLDMTKGQSRNLVMEEIFNRVIKCLEEGLSLDQIAIASPSLEDKAGLIGMARNYGIPLANPLNKIEVEASLLLHEIETLLTFTREGQEGLSKRLLLKLFPLGQEGEALDRILGRFQFDSLYDLEEDLGARVWLPMGEGDYKLLFDSLPLLLEDYRAHDLRGLGQEIDLIRGLLEDIDPSGLQGQDPQIRDLVLEIIQDLDSYRSYLENLDPQDFFDILVAILARREGDQGAKDKGLTIVSLQEALGLNFSHLFVYNMNSDFPSRVGEDFLKNAQKLDKLQAMGLFLDHKDRQEVEEVSFLHTLGGVGHLSLFQGGARDDLSPLWLDILGQVEDLEEGEVQDFDQEAPYRWTRTHEILGGQPGGPSQGSQGQLEGKSLTYIFDQLRRGAYSATLLENYLSCPFRSLVETFILDKEDLYVAQSEVNKAMGTIYHTCLERYYREGVRREDLGALFNGVANKREYLDIFDKEEYPLKKEKMFKCLEAFVDMDQERLSNEKKDKGFRPYLFEERFSFQLEGVRFRGSIDRIDRNEAGQEVLIDYKKTSGHSLDQFAQGQSWQLPLYGYSRYLASKEVVGLAYGNIEKGNFSYQLRNAEQIGPYPYATGPSQRMTQAQVEEFFQGLEGRVRQVLDQIEGGVFPPIPLEANRCIYCKLQDLCRKEEVL